MGWLGCPGRMLPWCLSGEVFRAFPTENRPWGRDDASQLTLKHPGFPPGRAPPWGRESQVWPSLLRLLDSGWWEMDSLASVVKYSPAMWCKKRTYWTFDLRELSGKMLLSRLLDAGTAMASLPPEPPGCSFWNTQTDKHWNCVNVTIHLVSKRLHQSTHR